ncbi:MAG: hypothetical protein IT436_07445 [Phycisphaerales bacterium]|nr:hypothetical protein [Phycisphaerales bacterium]
MPLIRQPLADPSVRDAVVLQLGDLRRAGEHLRDSAAREAESILTAARAERDRIISGADRDGHAKGLERGLREGRERGAQEGRAQAQAEWHDRLSALETGWTAALESFLADRERMMLEARQDVLQLAVLLAERITKRAIRVDPTLVNEQVAEVLSLVARPSRLVISLHPEDRPIVEEVLPGLRRRFPSAQEIEMIDDAALPRGSCIARTAGGTIDASISTQLDRIGEALIPGGVTQRDDLPPAPADDPPMPGPAEAGA